MSKIDEEFMSTRPRETQTRFDYVFSVGARLFRGLSIDAKRDLDDFEGRNDEPPDEPETEEDALDIPAAEETPEIVDPFMAPMCTRPPLSAERARMHEADHTLGQWERGVWTARRQRL